MGIDIEELKSKINPRLRPIIWRDSDNTLVLLDQRKLPFEETYVELRDPQSTADAIRQMIVRGAPAIGITAAYGMVLAIAHGNASTLDEALNELARARDALNAARPTAQNLFWATERMLSTASNAIHNGSAKSVRELLGVMKREAKAIFDEEFDAELRMGIYGLEKVNDGDTILTQCNAGGLATGTGIGTATAPIRVAHALGIRVSVIAPETRPWLQGARLTVYELMADGIPVTLIADTAVGYVMYRGMVNSVMVGADRILRDGHVYNKIGTFKEAVIAHELGIPFYAIAPSSTFDLRSRVEDVKIEERDPDEVRKIRGVPIAPENVPVFNPVFDVTPPKYVTALITERGIIYPPFDKNVPRVLSVR
ncbi:S-methyl-5-thioribose-1-phosphate isomerase [Vulcanisaeta souniana]|uniref:Putative methylthioribose-1-phosphate isomerase n=1 Tax=Vulcanisaeta souniana JCM 11219 TaxID=1293586 RepID=A0A830EFZ3_9CREN|nr:S-methyl-5-thioribose-1-phosphate isomerase [Vulcanisaeta souniana]BDR92128.1 S-methyl-5-thioribose-1-phosphate isomerase [Vulcanisaeta souniana JCM 11219]GGI67723.1 S-methyl-5-thioribose-1-phosphate isomerase [Vulcanisaeta souniana JCM 11219]